jgi:hypothetical protein
LFALSLLIEPLDGLLLLSFPIVALFHFPADSSYAISLKFLFGSFADHPWPGRLIAKGRPKPTPTLSAWRSGASYASTRFAQRLKVSFQQFDDKRLIARPTPAVAINAANQHLAVTVDLDERPTAVGTIHLEELFETCCAKDFSRRAKEKTPPGESII